MRTLEAQTRISSNFTSKTAPLQTTMCVNTPSAGVPHPFDIRLTPTLFFQLCSLS
jgi:hypothetical protein